MNTEQTLYASAGLASGLLIGMIFALVIYWRATRPNQSWSQCDWTTANHNGGDGSTLTMEREPIPKNDGDMTKNEEPKTP